MNLSVTNLRDPHFPDQVIGLLNDARLPGPALELELTEDLFMADPPRARTAVRALLTTIARELETRGAVVPSLQEDRRLVPA